jgi:hypothetical protein
MNRIAKTATAGLVVAGTAVGAIALAPAASASADRERWGMTAQGTEWDLSLSRERGIIEYDFDIDSRERGETWTITITRNGTTVFRGVRTTDRWGETGVERRVRDLPGVADRFVVRAVSSDGDVVRTVLSV